MPTPRSSSSCIKEEWKGKCCCCRAPQIEIFSEKMVDFANQRFTLRCLSNDIIPVRVRLKISIRTSRSYTMIKRDEKQLSNELKRSINNTLELCRQERDTCINHLTSMLDQAPLEECIDLMKRIKETRHIRTLEHHKSKF